MKKYFSELSLSFQSQDVMQLQVNNWYCTDIFTYNDIAGISLIWAYPHLKGVNEKPIKKQFLLNSQSTKWTPLLCQLIKLADTSLEHAS